MVASVQVKTTKSGNNMAIVSLEDLESSVDVVFFSQAWEKYRDILQPENALGNPVIHVRGKFERSDRGVQIRAFEVNTLSLDGAASHRGPSALALHVSADNLSNDTMNRLSAIFERYPGTQPVTLYIKQADGRKFRAQLPVSVNCASREMLQHVGELIGTDAVELK